VDKPMIGIRQADGSFYEIMDETAIGHKRLVLSAARTDQKGVRIELFRSVDGVASEEPLGIIALEDPEGLGYQDIEFRIDLAEGRLDASAALPGQAPHKLSVDLAADGEAPHRSDAAILEDDSLGTGLDTLDESFLETDAEPATLDLPDLRDDELEPGMAPESFDMPDLEENDFELPGLDDAPQAAVSEPAGEPEPDAELASFEMPVMDEPATEEMPDFDLPDLDEPSAAKTAEPEEESDLASEPASFDMDDSFEMPPMDDLSDLSAEPEGEAPSLDEMTLEPEVPAAAEETEDSFSLDDLGDMEAMEFMDTGHELSAPAPKAAPAKTAAAEPEFGESELGESEFDVSMDSASEFGELPELDNMSSFDDLPGLDDGPGGASSHDSDEDLDFMAPPELTETPWAEPDAEEFAAAPAKDGKTKRAKPPKTPKARGREVAASTSQGGGLDKTALFLSLTSLSLLVLLILVLLFLNMVKSPQAPVIQPEVMRFTPAAPVAERRAPVSVDLTAGQTFEASTVLEVPAALRSAQVSLTLAPGDTAEDAQRRFGAPSQVRGNQLFW
jgi:hypothetical protein